MNNLIVHIPHSSLRISKEFEDRLLISKERFNEENMFLCDYKIDEYVPNKYKIIKFKYSRMMCDVERYKSNDEVMNKYGMGYIYSLTSNKEKLIDINKEYIKHIDKIYDEHHNRIDNECTKILKKNKKCYIIDMHSFSDELVNKLFDIKDSPDICIGINTTYDKKILDFTLNFFEMNGYTVKINYPYSGSLLPNKYTNDNRIITMMIEINRRIYSNKLKEIMNDYFNKLDMFIEGENNDNK